LPCLLPCALPNVHGCSPFGLMQAGRRGRVTRRGAVSDTDAGCVMNLKTQVQACPWAAQQGQLAAHRRIILHLNKCMPNKDPVSVGLGLCHQGASLHWGAAIQEVEVRPKRCTNATQCVHSGVKTSQNSGPSQDGIQFSPFSAWSLTSWQSGCARLSRPLPGG
jgi:hypothetical protein